MPINFTSECLRNVYPAWKEYLYYWQKSNNETVQKKVIAKLLVNSQSVLETNIYVIGNHLRLPTTG